MFEPIKNRLRRWHLRNLTRRQLALLDDRREYGAAAVHFIRTV